MENEKQIVTTGQSDVPRKARKIGSMTYLVGVHFNEDSRMDVSYVVQIPANTDAEIHLENGEVYHVGSGRYEYEVCL